MEIWRDVKSYEGFYQVSNLGNVKSLIRTVKGPYGTKKILKEKILKNKLDYHGYYNVGLFKYSKGFTIKVHQLVAISFLNHVPCGPKLVVNHKNFIRTDNRLENLEIITTRENSNLKHIKSKSQYVGVSWHKHQKKWISRIVFEKKRKHLGYFENEYDAHLAYEKELLKIINYEKNTSKD